MGMGVQGMGSKPLRQSVPLNARKQPNSANRRTPVGQNAAAANGGMGIDGQHCMGPIVTGIKPSAQQ